MADGATVVLDIGKTWSKAGLWSADGSLLSRRARPNERKEISGYLALDVAGITEWLVPTLKAFADIVPVERIIPVSHGAGLVLVRDGRLVLPPMDYEHPIPGSIRNEYDTERDPFLCTGSPSLPDGLNLGAQLFYLQSMYPDALRPGTQVMLWAQYWSWLLSAIGCSEVTSLGCHTDLWSPPEDTYSRLAVSRGWAALMPPMKRAGEPLGELLPEWCEKTGLGTGTVVHCGLHDSNAALLAARGFPEIAGHDATVLSTGTWFVAMRTPQQPVPISSIPDGRDCLVNVDAYNQMIPSSRFMGGREIELLTGIDARRIDIKPDQPALLAALDPVVAQQHMMVPTLVPGTGPYPHGRGRWLSRPDDPIQCRAAVCLYAALLADASLNLIGASGRLLVEGRFAESAAFVNTLAALRPDMVVYSAHAHSDVSYGALKLLNPRLAPPGKLVAAEPIEINLQQYREHWRAESEQMGAAAA